MRKETKDLEFEKEYPLNLLDAIASAGFKSGKEWEHDLPPDYKGSVEYVLYTYLTERETMILHKYYRDGMNFEQIGKECSVTRERIRQIQMKAIRKLGHPIRQQYLIDGVCGAMFVKQKQTAEELVKSTLNETATCLKRIAEDIKQIAYQAQTGAIIAQAEQVEEQAKKIGVNLSEPIEDMDFSVRTFNCLKRAGADTLGRITQKSRLELERLHDMGKKSVDEIEDYLHSKGLELAEEKADE